jgi:preprotein translocase SecF subunit
MYLVSALVISAGVASFVSRGEKNLGVDFSGGTLQQFRFTEDVSTGRLRKMLKSIGLGDAVIQRIGGEKEVIVRTYGETSDRIMNKLTEEIGAGNFEVLRIEKVGPAVGRDLTQKGIKSLFFALLGICIYVSLRFEFKFALAAIAALFHDVLVCLGALSLTGRELSLPVIAALLAIIGYSINDTIVVFDRVRENLRLMHKISFAELVNLSINQTLNRTILTSLTTLLVVLSLFFFGGEVINSFAFVLLVGVIVGTYSSIFIASPLVVDWTHRVRLKK